jgi:hypothetical protein
MIDPFTALAGIKAAVSAGKELVSVTKQIGEFFDGVDDLRNKHTKKKNSVFAKDAEEELRQIVIATRGFSAWGELQEIRARVRRERKEREAAEKLKRQQRLEAIVIFGGSIAVVGLLVGIIVVVVMGLQGKI